MKKIIGILIVSLFMLGAASVPALKPAPQIQPQPAPRSFTHAVFAEDGTATWCGYCHYARAALNWVYNSHDYPFYYVCLIDDMNTHADARITEYNIQGYPTVFFDGGYDVQVGGGTGNEQIYRNSIQNTCGPRVVPDINTSLSIDWLGSGDMDITVNVHNNDSVGYAGKLKVYVCEDSASIATWHDTTGHPYTMAFLDYAQNQNISVAAGNTWSNTYSWDGSNHNDGHGHNFGTCTADNLIVIATVFNATWHLEYSYPPSQGPFHAYYVDDCVGQQVAEHTDPDPATPSNPSPADGATNVAINKDLSWSCSDPNGDTLKYDVYFGTTSPPPLVKTHQTTTSYDTGTMVRNTTYYWKIVVWDEWGNSVESPEWSFTTAINHAPPAPSNPSPGDGTTNIPTNKDLSWTCTDPDGDTLHFDVYFGTTNPPPKVANQITAKTWDTGAMEYNTTYYWKIVATDGQFTNESPVWSFTTGQLQDVTPPTVRITKPLAGYIYNNDNDGRARIFFSKTFIIKKITVMVNATDTGSGMNKVEFYIDNELVGTATTAPYTYVWDEVSGFSLKGHTLQVKAYDNADNKATSTLDVMKFK